MAEDIRGSHPDPRSIEDRRRAIIAECKRQEESCLYTSTTLYIWLRRVRRQKQFFVAAPIVIGGIAGLSILQEWGWDWAVAVLAFIASLFPALADALKFETSVDEISRLAAEFKSLQDRFRRTANITALDDVQAAEGALAELMDRMDIARSNSITPPESAFKEAQQKIEKGHYNFAVDQSPSGK
ncbi:SLATT domain-containing protein [Sinorhizobium fredii]|uniref:SLATT domain-containing protein n=1 Tax=Rhizobium fredii TaxID=380 RepID=UPI0005956247|nr:SLATT domain-containing protein [Sinorhizobium fredii]WOS64266.1 SLATT domain-containing protein [Sinorhizobium fredii GR64]